MAIAFDEPAGEALLHIKVLGGFRVERDHHLTPITQWQRRSAKTLTKLLAASPGHALHRDQVLELLWPGSSLDSALNSFGKALHAARRAFQPGLPPRQPSPYLLMVDSMVALDAERVMVDADRFEQAAHDALRQREPSALETAIAMYVGDLLPEDRYADWSAPRREVLADLRVRLLLEVADLLEVRGAYNDSADRLRAVLQHDPTREDVHRRLMRLYTAMGTPDQAVRQFHACEHVLKREFDLAPEEETVAVYHDVLAHRTPAPESPLDRPSDLGERTRLVLDRPAPSEPFVGRREVVAELCAQLVHPPHTCGMVVVSGEAGIGKTRLLEELAKTVADHGSVVLWGGAGRHGSRFASGPFAIALEGYVAGRPLAERRELARRYPALRGFVPSLVLETRTPRAAGAQVGHLEVAPAIVRLLTDIARDHPVLAMLGDLLEADEYSLDIIGYLAQLATDRRWLLVGAVRDEEVEPGTPVARLLATLIREGLCRKIELEWLTRADCHQLVTAMLPGASGRRELLDQIYELSRGNPMFARELVRGMRTFGMPAGASDAARIGDRVPSGVRALADTRLASLDGTVQRILLLVAAAGSNEVSFEDLRTGAAALDPPVGDGALLDALDRALETRLLEERAGVYAFRHPLVRLAIYERLPRHRRAQLGHALRRSTECSV